LHEIIHTSLFVAAASNASAGIYPPSNYQHYQMLSGYMDEMVLALTNFFPDLTIEQAKSLSLNGLGDDKGISADFGALIARWGFNANPSSSQNWAYFSQRHEVGEVGSLATQIGV
jgi:hypothetical protein